MEAETPLLRRAARELAEYFSGERRAFDLPLSLEGTAFQRADWAALCEIPYGETRSYGQIAARLGNPKACRAVGMANHRNPVGGPRGPCHGGGQKRFPDRLRGRTGRHGRAARAGKTLRRIKRRRFLEWEKSSLSPP